MLVALITLATDQPWMAMLQFEHPRRGMKQNRNIEVGDFFQEEVRVVADVPMINTTTTQISGLVGEREVKDLPLNGRSFNTLLQLTPGVTIAPSSTENGSPGQFSISGQRTDSNNFSIDGVSANFGVSPGVGGLGQSGTGNAQAFSAVGGTSSLVSVDALQEFRSAWNVE